MADVTRDVYLQYAKKIVSVLNNDDFYSKFKTRVDNGASNFKLAKKRLIQDIAIDWIETIEDCLPNLDNIVRNPRKFIVQEEDIVDISLAKSISTESVKHLAQHTNMISKVDADGTVTPNRILNITKEESYEIYENRFIYTLLVKLKDFVTLRYDKIKKASATQDILELDVESRFNLPSKKITYRTEYFAQLSFDEVMQLDPDTLTKIERIAKIDRIITDFLSSGFAKQMRNSAPVRPPITRTNVILKEPNFKKTLTLWQFVETYQQTGGFSTSDEVENYPLDEAANENLSRMVTLNTMLFESMYEEHEKDMEMEDAEFADFINVGKMEFLADKMNKEEYGQKLDKQFDKQEEEKEEIEAKSTDEPDEADLSSAEKDKLDKQEKQDGQDQRDVAKEIKTPDQKEEKTSEDLTPEKEPEPTPEEEMEVEAPPKEFDDSEPDAEDFDNYLFDVRKVYKLPKEDKIRQTEVIKAKDAIDRCLMSYRKIKQEILDMRDLEFKRKRKREEAEKRAEAFRKQRDIIQMEYTQSDSLYFGIDPFKQQNKKMILHKEEEVSENRPLVVKKERLSLEDKDLENIKKSIDKMEKDTKSSEKIANKKKKAKSSTTEKQTKANKKNSNKEKENDKNQIVEVASDNLKNKPSKIKKSAIDLNNPYGTLGADVFGSINPFDVKADKAEKIEKRLNKIDNHLTKKEKAVQKNATSEKLVIEKTSKEKPKTKPVKPEETKQNAKVQKSPSIKEDKNDNKQIKNSDKSAGLVNDEKFKQKKSYAKKENKAEATELNETVKTKFNLNLAKIDDPFAISGGGVDVFATDKKRRTSADILFDEKKKDNNSDKNK